MIRYLLLFFLMYTCLVTLGQDEAQLKNVEREFEAVLKKEDFFHKKRIKEINNLKAQMAKKKGSKKTFDLSYQLFQAYKKFQTDSALIYLNISKSLVPAQDIFTLYQVDLDLAALYSSSGKYIAALDLLETLDRNNIPNELLAKYYATHVSFYSQYGQSNDGTEFYQKSERYRDSLLHILDKNSLDYKLELGIKNLYAGDREEAQKSFLTLINDTKLSLENTALINYLLGLVYKYNGETDLQQYYFTKSAIADIQLANKDNASLQDLALTYYETGNIDHAFKTIDKSIKDATFCNMRYRIVEGTLFYPIINAAYQKEIDDQRKKLIVNLVLISILSLILIGGFVFIINQNKTLKNIKTQLSATNDKLRELNTHIHNQNLALSESNHIKEEYIAQFFDMCSSYIEKIDTLRKTVLKKATSNQTQELINSLKSTSLIEKETAELYQNFDSIFLNLYPTFVDDFNSLLREDERILLKDKELLNTELRLFALIRLGIDDSVKIASFLRYSLRTVYNYRTKVRNKAAVDRTQFEDLVKNIGNIDR